MTSAIENGTLPAMSLTKNESHAIAITDAKLTDASSSRILNIGLKKGKIIALGYLPDDEPYLNISAKDHLIIPNPVNLATLASEGPLRATHSFIHSLYNSVHFLSGHDLAMAIHNNTFPLQKPILCQGTLSEWLYINQHIPPTASHPLHYILDQPCQEGLDTISSYSGSTPVSFGLILTPETPNLATTIQTLIAEKKVMSLSSTQPDTLCPLLLQHFGASLAGKLSMTLFSDNIPPLFGISLPKITLGSALSACIIHSNHPYTVLADIKDGTVYKKE